MLRQLAALGLIVGLFAAQLPAGERPPNFVFFLVDDLGYMDVGCNNPKTFYETPNIDRLAKSGMRFTSGYAACPVCSPTRYSIMTGKYPTRVGATNFFGGNRAERFTPAPVNDRMPLEEVTLAESLKKHGYVTFMGGKWHLGNGPEFSPQRQGFDVVASDEKDAFKDSDREHLSNTLADAAVTFIGEHKDQPFFVYLPFHAVHVPLRAPTALLRKYEAKDAAQTGKAKVQWANEEQIWPVEEKRHVRIAQRHPIYAAMVETMDAAVGKVLKNLDELGLAENTVVVFASDNGGLSTAEGMPTSNLPLRGGKGWLYEGGIRVPFIVRAPGVAKPGSTCGVPIVSTDCYPTFLDLAGLPAKPEQTLDGVSLKPLLAGQTELDRDAIYWHYPHYSNQGGMPGGAIRRGDWKLIERYEDGRVQLYNLAEDIGEHADLAEKHPERVADLRKALHAWYKDVDAKFLTAKNDGPEPWRP